MDGVILFFAVLIAGLGLWIAWSAKTSRDRMARAEADAKVKAEREARQRVRHEREEARKNASDAIVRIARRSVEEFEAIPRHLSTVETSIAEARRYRLDGAFSPFWAEIEQAYAALGGYRDNIIAIEEATKSHAGEVKKFVLNGGDPGNLADFPVHVDENETNKLASGLLKVLGDIVYDAQKDAIFAQIWEQRRTTAAVISGFQNLEGAVRGMGSAVSASIAALSSTVVESNSEISRSLQGIGRNLDGVTGAVVSASAKQIEEMKRLNSVAKHVHNEVFEIGHGRPPIM